MKNVVFYSNYKRDINSPKLLALIKTMPFAKEFFYFCIDPDPVTRKRNEPLLFILDVVNVPTMFVNGEKLEGKEAFAWLRQVSQQLHQEPQYRHDSQYQEEEPPESYHQEPHRMQGRPQQAHKQESPGGSDEGLFGAMDSSFADPFTVTDSTGINSMNIQGLTPAQVARLVNPEPASDESTKMNDDLRRVEKERGYQSSPAGNVGIPGLGGKSMQDLQIPRW